MSELHSEKFHKDPRVQEAKRLMQSALRDAQMDIVSVKGADPERKSDYKSLLLAFEKARGNPLFYPYIGSGIGNGALVELLDGSIKYDLITGIGPHYLGHSSQELFSSQIDAALSDIVMQGNLLQNQDALDLSTLLCKLSNLDHCFLSSSGAMACENSLKISFQKKPTATRVLAFEHCFAGRTLALSCITDKPNFRQGLPLLLDVDYLPFYDERRPEESTIACISTLKKLLARYPKQHAVMCLELVQGEGGFWVGSEHFFKSIIKLLKEHEIAVWIDEVQTFARTEELFAFQYFQLDGLVDIVSIGKVAQVCATLFTKEFCPKPGLISQTFTASTSAIRTAYSLIKHAMKSEFFGKNGKIANLHKAFVHGLEKYHNVLEGPFGIGAMIGCTPFHGDIERVKQFAHRLFDNGVIAFTAGSHPTRLRFLPPVGVLNDRQIKEIIEIIGKSI